MRFRLALALLISVLLVGGTTWHRISSAPKAPVGLIAVETTSENSNHYDGLPEVTNVESQYASTSSTTKPLSSSELIGRRLILDYVDLATSGQATEATITALAERYVESVPTLNQAKVITYADIKTTSNTRKDFQNYANEFESIYKEYANQVSRAYSRERSPRNLTPSMTSFLSSFSEAYTSAATKLQKVPTPLSLAPSHLKLINSYLSSAASLKAISKNEDDSAAAFAGLINFNSNLDKEELLVKEITKILNSNGI